MPAKRTSLSHSSVPSSNSSNIDTLLAMRAQIERMAQHQAEMSAHVSSLTMDFENVRDQMTMLERSMGTQDELMQNIVQCCIRKGVSGSIPGSASGYPSF